MGEVFISKRTKKSFVTGANGFLGSYVVRELLQQGYVVQALVRPGSDVSLLENAPCEIVRGDILDVPSMEPFFQETEVVFHLAGAMSSMPKDRARVMKVNVEGTRNILALSKKYSVKKLIHVSSSVAVGACGEAKVLNEEAQESVWPGDFSNYVSKRLGEELVLEEARGGGLPATVLNPGLIYGAGDARKAIRQGNVRAAQGRLPFFTSGGVNIVPVEDVAAAVVRAHLDGKNGERYLLTGENQSIEYLLKTIASLAGAKPPTRKLPDNVLKRLAAANDFFRINSPLTKEGVFAATAYHWYDNSKAKRDLGFSPGPALEALRRSVQWMKENNYLENP
jgi:dihydroflavonol-4-reductase